MVPASGSFDASDAGAGGVAASGADAAGFAASGADGVDFAASGAGAGGVTASGTGAPGFAASVAGAPGFAASGADGVDFAARGAGAAGFATSGAGGAGLAASGMDAEGFAASGAGADGLATTELAAPGAGIASRGTACCAVTVPDTAFGITLLTGLAGRSATYPATAATRNNTTSAAMTHTNGDRLGARQGSYFAWNRSSSTPAGVFHAAGAASCGAIEEAGGGRRTVTEERDGEYQPSGSS